MTIPFARTGEVVTARESSRLAAFAWSVRRELLENRSLYLGPSGAAAIFLVGFFISMIARPDVIRAMSSASASNPVAAGPYMYAALLIMATGAAVGLFYCLDALYAERRDRSILFWKSLPVSDATTVMSKAAVAFAVLPLITLAITIVVHTVMLLSSSLILVIRGADVGALWRAVLPLSLWGRLLYHMLSIHVLWYAPIFAWLLLASAWARRAPVVWAGLPVLAIVVVERLVFGTSKFLAALKDRLTGGPEMLADADDMLGHANPYVLVHSLSMWVGVALSIVFLLIAVRVRRMNTPT
jgi:ABC-2 type transport system permease protein